jgi:hypothetical protein
MKTPILILKIIVVLLLTGCYVSKPLNVEVKATFNKDFTVVIKNEGNSNFSGKHTQEEYRTAYINELVKELAANHIKIDNGFPEYVIQISELEITESTKMDTVKDVKSPNNGMVRELTLAGLKTNGTVGKKVNPGTNKWTAEKDKNESITNNRSLEQIIDGKNKDNTVYREKTFADDEFVIQSGVCGRRAAVRITHEIQKLLGK